jgi:hypothetical protein
MRQGVNGHAPGSRSGCTFRALGRTLQRETDFYPRNSHDRPADWLLRLFGDGPTVQIDAREVAKRRPV